MRVGGWWCRGVAFAVGLGGTSLGAGVARAEPPAGDLAVEHEDDHVRPPEYDDPDFVMPPFSADVPDYPLAAGFVPADPSNYTPGGITSYQYVVVHTMQGSYAGSIGWFQNPVSNVSAHYCMRSVDGEITQMVHDVDKAWHVGTSNSVALGIEHEGYVDEQGWYTWEMYSSSARLARWLCEQHEIPVTREHILGHVELPNQTHTDPGPLWDWDLYMALVRDVVLDGVIEGVVVDASRPCTATANTDTWLKRTLESADVLADDEKCLIPAGTAIDYLHASGDMDGHHRWTMGGGGPCVGIGNLDLEAFAITADWDGECPASELAAAGIEVTLDGGETVPVDDTGAFSFSGLAVGDHDLDFAGDGWEPTMETVSLDVYPGARIVVAVMPVGAPDPGGSTGGGGSSGGREPVTTGTSGVAGTSGSPADGSSGGNAPPSLPATYGQDGSGAAGCGCRSSGPAPVWAMWWLVGGLVLVRRRRPTA